MKERLFWKSGFTLMELLVVIGIIAILSAVVLASLSGARANARDGKRLTDIKQLQLAIELYGEGFDAYPSEGGNLLLSQVTGLTPTFIAALPTDPRPTQSGNNGQYRYAEIGSDGYVLVVSSIEHRGSVTACYVVSEGVDPESDLPSAITDVYGTPGEDADFADCDSL